MFLDRRIVRGTLSEALNLMASPCGTQSGSFNLDATTSCRGILDCVDSIMKTTVDIPDRELEDAMRFTRARTKREAIVTAITEFNRRRRIAELTKRAGTCPDLMTVDELQHMRRRA